MNVLWQMSQTIGEVEDGVLGVTTPMAPPLPLPPTPTNATPPLRAFLIVVVVLELLVGVVGGGVNPGRNEESGDGVCEGVTDGEGERPDPGDLSDAGLPWGRCGVDAFPLRPPGEAGERMTACPGDLEVPGDLPCPGR